jgi:uncharacterized protein YbbC (DUF1343 family)
MSRRIAVGLEQFLHQPPQRVLEGARFGLLMNQASVTSNYEYACDVLDQRFPEQLTAIFAPQHGLWGEQQANMIESAHAHHSQLDVPIYSLYAESREPSAAMLANIDILIVDLQDVGTRVYTFVWTVVNCLRACKLYDIPVILLDRPNPIGGSTIEGPLLESSFRSFVGLADIPMRHGLSLGELARYCNRSLEIQADLHVVPMIGWNRNAHLPAFEVPWCAPSPNMPRYETTLVYPGQVLLEGTNLSEGRGTTTPFEIVGAPFIDPYRLAARMNSLSLPGVHFRPLKFVPTFDKWQGESCGGIYLHVTDPLTFRSYQTTVEILHAVKQLYADDFAWLPPPYEYEHIKMPIDILSGSENLRLALEDGNDHLVARCHQADDTNWLQLTAGDRIY